MAFVRVWPPRAVVGCWPRDARKAASASLLDSGWLLEPVRLLDPTRLLDPSGSPTLSAALLGGTAPQGRGPSLPANEVSAVNGLVRLQTRADFLRVAAGSRRAVRPGLVLQAAPYPPGKGGALAVRVGFTASRKVGNAVIRNRAKRRLRAAASEVLGHDGRQGTDYVLIARAGTAARTYG